MTTIKPTTTFWVISVLSLLWNISGCFAYVTEVMMTPHDMPVWVTTAFALAVWGSLLGSVLLLTRKKVAGPIFVASFAAILVQMTYSFFMTPMIEVSGAAGIALPLLIIIVGALLILFSRNAAAKGWLV